MIDDLYLMRQFLVTNYAIGVKVGTRVYAGRNSPAEGWNPAAGSCIAFKRRGGGQDELGTMVSTSFQFKCYGGGGTIPEQVVAANALYRTLRDVLNYTQSYEMLGAQEEGRGSTFGTPLETEGDFPYVLCFFRVQFRETTFGL